MSNSLTIRKQVTSVPKALAALAAMERQLTTAKTYDALRKIEREASALKVLMRDVAEVKDRAEDTILLVNHRIGEELAKVPKAKGGGQLGKGGFHAQVKSSAGRSDTGIKRMTRSRLGKLAAQPAASIKAVAAKLREEGKEATVTAVVRAITQGDKKKRRAQRERDLAKKQKAMPDQRYGVILCDNEWKFETWSEDTGSDRAASNHYPVSHLAVLRARPVQKIAADDCVLFMWVTVPMLAEAFSMMSLWGFRYVSHFIWNKNRIGTGYWNRNKHEVLLIGTRGNVPAPAPGTQWPSVIDADVGRHSAKPEVFFEIIESYYPNLPKIELNRRGPARPGWDAWGNEVEEAVAAE